ncbi:MAG TPA: vWA domain-containing protein [Nitrospirota bacterium]|nr:vWA domain-containing protein [Nitrospirota bacterium]
MKKFLEQTAGLRQGGARSGLKLMLIGVFLFGSFVAASNRGVAQPGTAAPGGYGLKVYKVSSVLYPFVQVYFRTFDQDMQPLVNLNERNIGLMVKGRAYDPAKRQYVVNSIRQRQEATRSVIVLDASKTMAGRPFEAALKACANFIDSKRPQDEVAILAVRNTKEGYETISGFERDGGALARRLADVRADGVKSRLYDTIGAAIQMCGSSSQGALSPSSATIIVSSCIVVLSDGLDQGSAITREELNTRISNMTIPIPVYSLAYSQVSANHFKNLEAISKNSFGKYYLIADTYQKMQKVVEEIQNIIQSDYVLTFRSYLPVDGESHSFKVGVEYPSGSGKYTFEDSRFEAIELPKVEPVADKIKDLLQVLPEVKDANGPYMSKISD